MKKIFSIILPLVLLVSFLPINVSAASTVIKFSSTDVSVNNTLSVTVTINADEPIYGVGCAVNYDPKIFEYISGASVGGNGTLQIIESPSGTTSVSYVLKFKALTAGSSVFTVSNCRYESLMGSHSLTGTSSTVTVTSNTIIANGNCGNSAIWELNKDGILIISGTGSTADYKLPLYAPWYEYRGQIESVIIENGITRIGNNNFSGLGILRKATIYTSDLTFGTYAFATDTFLTIECFKNSSAEKYALENGYDILILGAPEAPVIESIEKTTATLKAVDGYEYSMDGINWQVSNIFSNIPIDEIVYFYQRTSGSDIDGALPISNAAKGISVSAPKVLVGNNCIWIKPTEGYEYGLEDLIWQDSNEFNEYIVSGESYAVYHRPANMNNIFVAYEGITVTVDGDNRIAEPKAINLVWLREFILNSETFNNLAADFNQDGEIDARDMVKMKKQLAY